MEMGEPLRTSSALSTRELVTETIVLLLSFNTHLVGPIVPMHKVCLSDFASVQKVVRTR